jgi:hypothetical protein
VWILSCSISRVQTKSIHAQVQARACISHGQFVCAMHIVMFLKMLCMHENCTIVPLASKETANSIQIFPKFPSIWSAWRNLPGIASPGAPGRPGGPGDPGFPRSPAPRNSSDLLSMLNMKDAADVCVQTCALSSFVCECERVCECVCECVSARVFCVCFLL